jgi:hypothetical protein
MLKHVLGMSKRKTRVEYVNEMTVKGWHWTLLFIDFPRKYNLWNALKGVIVHSDDCEYNLKAVVYTKAVRSKASLAIELFLVRVAWDLPTRIRCLSNLTVARQGDQMRLWKSRPNCSQIHLLWKLQHLFYRGKSSQIICATSVIFIKTTNSKQSPIGENSLNLVTLEGVERP